MQMKGIQKPTDG